jgi:Mannosyltransferase (PIG-V)
VAQHVLLLSVVYIGRTLLETRWTDTSHPSTITWSTLFTHWLGWDGSLYAAIARIGYTQLWTAGLSPLLPLLEHVVWSVTGLDPAIAGVLIANVAGLGAFAMFRVLVEREWDGERARRALIYLAIFPTAFFLAVPYTESLFLLFSVSAFLALRRSRWIAAGVFTGLAILTRSTGIVLVVPLLVEFARRYWPQPSWKLPAPRALATLVGALLVPGIAQGGQMLFLAARFGTPFAMSKAQSQIWGKSVGIPLIGFARAAGALLRDGTNPGFFQVHILLDMAFTLLAIVLTVATWRRLPLSYVLYAWAVLFVIVATPNHNWYALSSNMRYMLASFPLFMVLAQWGKDRRVDLIIVAASLPLLTLFMLIFVMAGWVA